MTFARLAKLLSVIMLMGIFFFTGCVQRKLTINTEPSGALITLNDEEIGTSPVTVGFEWYGDYSIIVSKAGYETLKTDRKLKRPVHDYFPFDLFYDLFGSNRIDDYAWNFQLAPYQAPQRDELINAAENMRKDTVAELEKPLKE